MGRPRGYKEKDLLHGIINCLWVQGYAATPISEIVERTGVNAASLYGKYGSKKGIMLAALELYAQETIADLEKLLGSVPAGPLQIKAVLEHAVAAFEDPEARGCFLVNSLASFTEDAPEFTDAVVGYMAAIRERLTRALAGAPGLRSSLTPAQAALFVQTQVWGLKIMARTRPTPEMGQIVIRQTLVALFSKSSLKGLLPDLDPEAV